MTNKAATTGFLGNISEANKDKFPQAVQEAFEFVQANPEVAFFEAKNTAAQWQYDKNVARQTLQELDTQSSLKEALTTVLGQLPNDRNDEYVRGFVQWFIGQFEDFFVEAKALAE